MKGFTVIELMIVLVIAGVLVTIGVPAMTVLIDNNRLASEANRFAGSVRYARSEAIRRNQVVTIDRISNTNRAWEDGWQIYVDVSGDGNKNIDTGAGDILLRQEEAAENKITIRSDEDGNQWLSYNGDGTLREGGDSAAYHICDNRGSAEGTAVTISPTGRVNTGAIADDDDCTPNETDD